MPTRPLRIPMMLAALITFAACSDAPYTELTAPATPLSSTPAKAASANGAVREIQEEFYDLTDSFVSFPCGDGYTEVVALEGKIYSRTVTTSDGAGGFHVRMHTMPVGVRGVGQESGAEYRISERESLNFNHTPMAETSRYELKLKLHAPAIGLRVHLVLGGRYVVNANGVVVTEREVMRAECSAQ